MEHQPDKDPDNAQSAEQVETGLPGKVRAQLKQQTTKLITQ